MKCPSCNNQHHVEVDTHADGFAENLQECGNCGALWIDRGHSIVLLHGGLAVAPDAA